MKCTIAVIWVGEADEMLKFYRYDPGEINFRKGRKNLWKVGEIYERYEPLMKGRIDWRNVRNFLWNIERILDKKCWREGRGAQVSILSLLPFIYTLQVNAQKTVFPMQCFLDFVSRFNLQRLESSCGRNSAK